MEIFIALGNYIVKKTGKNFDFKQIKGDSYFKNNLFSIGTTFYLISTNPVDMATITYKMSHTKFSEYPAKFAKKYTHMRFVKAELKNPEVFTYNNKRYYIIIL
jgi:hypothetical protein